jgi:hypothetical protein
MDRGAPADNVAGGASIHVVETAHLPLAHLGIKQTSSLRIGTSWPNGQDIRLEIV